MSSNNSPQNENDQSSSQSKNTPEGIGQKISQLFNKFMGGVQKRSDDSAARYEALKKALDEGDVLPLQREWKELESTTSTGDMVADTHAVRVAQLWGQTLVQERRWAEAQQVVENALAFKAGIATQRFDLLFLLADVLRMEAKNDEAYTLLHDHPLARQIMQMARMFPGSDTGAKLAHIRFDFAEEARLHLLAFTPSPLLPLPSLQEELSGDEAKRRLKAALAYYYAGQISSAIEQAEQARAISKSATMKSTSISLLIMWKVSRHGWDAVADLLEEAQAGAASPALEAQAARKLLMKAAQTGDFVRFEELAREHGDDVSVQQQYAEVRALQGRFGDARQWVGTMIEGAQVSDSSVSNHRRRALALLTQVLVELYAVHGWVSWDAGKVELALGCAREMLRGDVKMTLWIRAYEAAFLAAQGKRSETQRAATEVAAQWEAWSDDATTLKVMSSQLGTAFLSLGEWDNAALWFERYLEVSFNSVYRVHCLELLARALAGRGDKAAARAQRRQVVASGFNIRAVELAQQALDGENV